jgi:hypothetical protein
MNRLLLSAASIALVLTVIAAPARADFVTDWNTRAFAVLGAERVGGGLAPARTLAMMHIAMFDAANAAEGKYLPYVAAIPEARGSSPVAAAHAAARRVLTELHPKQKAKIDAEYEAAMAPVAADPARSAGISAGEKAALAILAARQSDGFFSAETYRPATSPSVYVPTAIPVLAHVGLTKPFALRDVSHFRPGPPPALESAQWARDYNETKDLGGLNSTKRTAWQTETARFWVLVGTPAWNQVTRSLATSLPLPLVESARLHALANIAIADAYLAIFDAKYHYAFWRPITAIRNGDRDGNDATERDAGWTPVIATPMHPEYPCAHCVIDGAAGTIMKAVFGAGNLPQFTLTYPDMPGVTRSYTSIKQIEEEVSMARIWGGVHYRTSNEVGVDIGHKVGQYVLDNYLRPVR